jgi:NitT/TauT family transport system substrate-binding protein
MLDAELTRRQLLRESAAAGIALSLAGGLLAACSGGSNKPKATTIRWVSPRGTLVAMDDYHLWVAQELGYFEERGITIELQGGPGSSGIDLVAAGQADMAYPAPGDLAAAVDQGTPVVSVWQQYPAQVFDFSLPEDSPVTSVQGLTGASLSVPVLGVKRIVEPLLVEAGIDPASVKLVENGAEWNLLVAQKKADAGLAWEGLRAQLMGQGLKLKYILGPSFSEGPSNAYAIRKDDLEDDDRRDALVRFLEAVVMGLEFARSNPRAAAQITYRAVPGLADRLRPQIAVNALVQIARGHAVEKERGNGWGFHNEASWRAYLETIAGLGQIAKQLEPAGVLTNELVERSNTGADVEQAQKDAEGFDLDDDFAQTTPPEEE